MNSFFLFYPRLKQDSSSHYQAHFVIQRHMCAYVISRDFGSASSTATTNSETQTQRPDRGRTCVEFSLPFRTNPEQSMRPSVLRTLESAKPLARVPRHSVSRNFSSAQQSKVYKTPTKGITQPSETNWMEEEAEVLKSYRTHLN